MKLLRLLCLVLPLVLVTLVWLFQDESSPDLGAGDFSKRDSDGGARVGREGALLSSNASAKFSGWLRSYRDDPVSADLTKGVELAKERREVLKGLIALNPGRALELAIPEEARAGLPGEIVDLLEVLLSTAGEFERVVSCYTDGLERPPGAPGEESFVSFDGDRYRAFTDGRRAGLQTKDRISLFGIAIDDALAFSPEPVRRVSDHDGLVVEAFGEEKVFASEDELEHYVAMLVADENAPGPGGQADFAESAWTEGNKRILYLRVRFADDDATYEPVTLATAQSDQDDVAAHYRMASYGKLNVTTVFPDMITLTLNKAEYVGKGLGDMMNEARAAAIVMGDAQGVDWNYNNFDLYTIISDRGIGPYAGIAQVGGRKSHHQRGYTSLRTSGHEFGHNLGLLHAFFNYSSDLNPRGVTPTNGLGLVEYGHRFSVMSAQSGSDFDNPLFPHFTVHEKWRLDWLTNADMVDVTEGGQTGTYRLYQNDDENATGLRALRVPSGGALSKYWLSYRTAWKRPNRGSDNDFLLNGVVFNWTGSGGGVSTLLDMTPYSNEGSSGGAFFTRDNSDKWDAALLIGRTYTDSESKVSITPMARGGAAPDEYIEVHVHLDTGAEITLLEQDSSLRAIIPTAGTASGTSWTELGFDDAGWPYSGSAGVGYDTGTDYNPFFGVNVIAMRSKSESCYIRIPFTIGGEMALGELESLKLRMRYDDGFVAYVNGVKIAEQNAPLSPTWNSGATRSQSDNDAVVFQEFSGDAALGALVSGVNVLAIHGLNNGTGSSDFLMQPVLIATISGAPNDPPTVSLAANTLVAAVNQEVTLTATGNDPEGDPLAYGWDFDIAETYAPEGLNHPVAVRRWRSAGLYVVTITCSDRKGGIARDRVLVKVGNPSNAGVVSGRVLQGGQPVVGARVFVEGNDKQCLTLGDGSYVMTGLSTSSGTTLGAMFDGDVFQPAVVMPVTPQPELGGVDFFGHAAAPVGSPDETMTVSPDFASTDTASSLVLTARIWDNTIAEDLLIPLGETWNYLDTGVDPGATWMTDGFDDGGWLSGQAELGYGDSQATVVAFGGDTANRHITTWFRRAFLATNVAEVSRLKLSVKRDDGVRVFLNGNEIARDNLTTGTVSAGTEASNEVSSSNEEILIRFNVDPSLLLEGQNILAAEIHQEGRDSSDLSFDLELSAARTLAGVTPTWSVTPSGASVSPVGLFTATDPGSYTVTATSGALTADTTILVGSDNVVTLTSLDDFLWENGSATATIRITRSGNLLSPLIVPLVVGGEATSGVDFSSLPTSVTIPAGQSAVDFLISALDDSGREGNERVSITPDSAGSFSVGSPALARVTILDDENALTAQPEAGTNITVTVNQSGALAGSLLAAEEFVVAGDYWKYSDGGAEPPAGWRGLAFDDSVWQEGLAQFGYGNGRESTTVSFGGVSGSKDITTYFRRRFFLDDPAQYVALTASVLVDDGAVIYLNGIEVQRINLPGGTIGFSTRADVTVGGSDEETFFDQALDPAGLIAGENILVVEVHQSSPSSSDLGFDLSLTGIRNTPGTNGGIRWSQQSGPGVTTFTDSGSLTSGVSVNQVGTYLLRLEDLASGRIDKITVTGEEARNYELWIGGYPGADAGPLADIDGDGLENLLEYALGGDPTDGEDVPRPRATEDPENEGDLVFTYRRLREQNSGDGSGTTGDGYAISGISYTVQASDGLGGWSSAASALTMKPESAPTDNGDGTETIVLRFSPPLETDMRWFMRLQIQQE